MLQQMQLPFSSALPAYSHQKFIPPMAQRTQFQPNFSLNLAASSYCPWSWYIHARLAIASRVSGCLLTVITLRISTAFSINLLASWYFLSLRKKPTCCKRLPPNVFYWICWQLTMVFLSDFRNCDPAEAVHFASCAKVGTHNQIKPLS